MGTEAREEACVDAPVKQQLVQTRKSLVVKTDEKEEVAAADGVDGPWFAGRAKPTKKRCKAPMLKGGKFRCGMGFKAQTCKAKNCRVGVKANSKGVIIRATKTCGKEKYDILKMLKRDWTC